MMDDVIHVVWNSEGNILLTLGDHGLILSREEAEALFVDLGHCLQDMDVMFNNEDNDDV